MKNKRIAIVANLANSGYLVQRSLLTQGIQSTLFISGSELGNPSDPTLYNKSILDSGLIKFWNIGNVTSDKRSIVLNKAAYKLSDNNYINLFKLIFHLRKHYDYIIGVALGAIPASLASKSFTWLAIGSDLRQHVHLKSLSGLMLKNAAKKATLILAATDSGLKTSIRQLKLENKTRYFTVLPITGETHTFQKPEKSHNEFTIFSPANHIWADLAAGHPGKGNDKLIIAFAGIIQGGEIDLKLKLLKRGPDWEKSFQLVQSLGIEDYVIWDSELDKDRLSEEIDKADIIADQFSIGSPGLTCLEAMSYGKPVLIYIDSNFPDKYIPIINCKTVDDIACGIRKCLNLGFRQEIGEKAVHWINENANYYSFGSWLIESINSME